MREIATLKIKGHDALSQSERSELLDWLHDIWIKVRDADPKDMDDNYVARFYVEERKRAA